jgi:hypothetical protein
VTLRITALVEAIRRENFDADAVLLGTIGAEGVVRRLPEAVVSNADASPQTWGGRLRVLYVLNAGDAADDR